MGGEEGAWIAYGVALGASLLAIALDQAWVVVWLLFACGAGNFAYGATVHPRDRSLAAFAFLSSAGACLSAAGLSLAPSAARRWGSLDPETVRSAFLALSLLPGWFLLSRLGAGFPGSRWVGLASAALVGVALGLRGTFGGAAFDLSIILFDAVLVALSFGLRTGGTVRRLLVAGHALNLLGDVAFLTLRSQNRYTDLTGLDAVWPLAGILLAAAGALAASRVVPRPAVERPPAPQPPVAEPSVVASLQAALTEARDLGYIYSVLVVTGAGCAEVGAALSRWKYDFVAEPLDDRVLVRMPFASPTCVRHCRRRLEGELRGTRARIGVATAERDETDAPALLARASGRSAEVPVPPVLVPV